MNVQAHILADAAPQPLKLTVEMFRCLKQSGAFAAYGKSELLNGEVFGVPQQPDDEPESDASVPIKLRVQDYRLLHDENLLDAVGKTELIDGLIYAMSPQYRPHGFIKDELAYRIRRKLEEMGSPLHVATEQSVAIAPHNEPIPDIILTSEPQGEGPIPVATIALVIEVSDNTLRFDLQEKAATYADAGIPEYWVADVNAEVIHQMWMPEDAAYSESREIKFGATINASTIDRLSVATHR